MSKTFLFLLFISILLLSILLTACEPYTVEGTVIGKVYEPAHSETSMIPAGKVIVPMSNSVEDKWYIEIQFTDKDGNQKIFYWGVTKENYEAYKIGDKTPVNVDDKGGAWVVLFPILLTAIVYAGYFVVRKLDKLTREKESMGNEVDEIEKVKRQVKSKPKLSIFGITIRRE